MQVNPLVGEKSKFSVPCYDQVDCKVFSPDQSHIHAELPYYMGSPFANDFGNYQDGLLFQDGTSEQDISLSDLLGDSCEESSQRNSVAGSDGQLLQSIPAAAGISITDIGPYYNEHQTEMAKPQVQFAFFLCPSFKCLSLSET